MARQYSSSEIAEIINRQSDQVSGGDKEFAKIMHAIVLTESGGNPYAVGDQGNSIGLFQNNMAGGRGAGHSKEDLLNPEYNASISIPALYRVYLEGASRGLRGADLVAFISRHGQRPAEGLEWNAAKNYGRTIGDQPIIMNEQTTQQQFNKTKGDYSKEVYDRWPDFDKYPQETKDYLLGVKDELDTRDISAKNKGKIKPLRSEQNLWQNFMNAIVKPVKGEEANMSKTPSLPNQYTVAPGDTLWGIAERTLGSGERWKELGGYTGDPRKLPIGTKITVPSPSKPSTPSTMYASKYQTPAYSAPMTKAPTPVYQTRVPTPTVFQSSQRPTYSTPAPTPVPTPTRSTPQPAPVRQVAQYQTRAPAPVYQSRQPAPQYQSVQRQSVQPKQSKTSSIIQNALNIVKSWFS